MESIRIIEDGEERVLEPEGDQLTIGRSPDSDLQVTAIKASRTHCRIEKSNGSYRLVDLGSSNGTRVNGVKVTDKALEPGDKIEIGSTVLLFGEKKGPRIVVTPDASRQEKDAGSGENPSSAKEPSQERKRRSLARTSREGGRGVVRDQKLPKGFITFLKVGGGVAALLVGVIVVLKQFQTHAPGFSLAARVDEEVKRFAEFEKGLATTGMKMTADLFEKLRSIRESLDRLAFRAGKSRILARARDLHRQVDALISREEDAADQVRRVADSHAAQEPLAALSELRSLLSRYPGCLEEKRILQLADDQKRAVQRNLDWELSAMGGTRKAMETLVQQGSFRGAVNGYLKFVENLKKQLTHPADRSLVVRTELRVEKEIRSIYGQAETAFRSLKERIDALVDEKKFDTARAIYGRARGMFSGIATIQDAIGEQVAIVQIVIDEGITRALAQKRYRMLRRYYGVLEEARDLARRKLYKEAMAKLRHLERKAAEDKAVGEMLARVTREMTGVRKIVLLFEKLVEQINKRGLRQDAYEDGHLKGRVLAADDAGFKVVNSTGSVEVVIKWSQLENLKLYRMLRNMVLTTDDHFTLAIFCFDNSLELPHGHAELIMVLEADPARRQEVFGFYSQRSGKPIPGEGFVVFKNRLMTPYEMQLAQAEDRAEGLIARLGSSSPAARQKAFAALEGFLGEVGSKFGAGFVTRIKKNAIGKLKHRKRHLQTALAQASFGNPRAFEAAKNQLNKARKHALELIFDTVKYPYPYGPNQRQVQKEADDRVEAVRKVWKQPLTGGTVNPAIHTIAARIKDVDRQIKGLDPSYDKMTDPVHLDYLKALATKNKDAELKLRHFALNGTEKARIAHNVKMMAANAEMKSIAMGLEKDQIRVTNEYRWMMGRRCVRIDDRLVKAARNHSAYMASSGRFAHVIPGHPHGASPMDRCRKEGYNAPVSENIAMGRTAPYQVHLQWLGSSGHHRNILMPGHKALGSGNSGKYWTQNFGRQ